jgi:hypothetical protein
MNVCQIQHPLIAFDGQCPLCREQARVRELEQRLAEVKAQTPEFLTLRELAAMFKVSRYTIWRWQNEGLLPPGDWIAKADAVAAKPRIEAFRAGRARKVVSMSEAA